MSQQDIDIRGMIHAERKSAPSILIPLKEALHNSLEAIRLARLLDPTNIGIIRITSYIRDKHLEKWSVFDQATKNTGIPNLESKELYKLYHHKGSQKGFSEYGMGGKVENLRCCDLIEHHTMTDSGIYEKTRWDIQKSRETNSLLDVIEYNKNPNYKPMSFVEGYSTGTLLECSGILPRLKNIATSDYITNMGLGGLFEDLNHSLVKFDSENIQIFYEVFENDHQIINKRIVSKNYLHGYIETRELICCEDKANREINTFIKQKLNEDDVCESILMNEITNESIKDDDIFETYYEGQKNNNLGSDRPKKQILGKELKAKYIIRSHIKLICSTAEYDDVDEDDQKFGFYGLREVEGKNIVCTTPEPLLLKWGKLKSHKTRHNQLRVGIQYDRKSDQFLLSDKSKTLSDDRDIEPSLRFNTLKLTDMYISKMRRLHKFYEADLNKRGNLAPAPAAPPAAPPAPPAPAPPAAPPAPAPPAPPAPAPPAPAQQRHQIEFVLDDSNESVATENNSEESELESASDTDLGSNSESDAVPDTETNENHQQQTTDTDCDSEESGSDIDLGSNSESDAVPDTEPNDQQQAVASESNSAASTESVAQIGNIIEYTIAEQKRTHVTSTTAIDYLNIIYCNYQKNNLMFEIQELFIKIACNLIGKGGDAIAQLFIKDIPLDKLYSNINIIWSQDDEQLSNVKMGSEVVNFVKIHNL
jgi:hypothetical protein